ncbi:MAG: metal ABC transporter ATP-binding protein [Tepidisphaeraceae bacterium]
MSSIVDISRLDFAYADQLVLKHVDLTVERGSTLGVIGPNGGGKTTLIRLLLGLLEPTRGTVLVDGLPPARAARRGDVVGYLPQRAQMSNVLPIDVRQVVRLGLAGKTGMLRSYAKDDLSFVDHLIERVGLTECVHQPVGQLSGGQLQRVLIARALAPRPKLLLLDEPTTGIDRSGQQRFIEFVQSLKQELGLTVVLVSHDLRAVSAISDRIACLNLTLHYHDVPEHLPADLVYRMFACDLEAMGINGKRRADQGGDTVQLRISTRRSGGGSDSPV